MADRTIHYRTCPLCEATCGLELHMEGRSLALVRGDRDDVYSKGFICPKGSALGKLDADPDRVRTPLVRRDGELCPASWDEAFAAIEAGLTPILEQHGRDAVAAYIGNPNAHNLSGILYGRALLQALGSRNLYSASTVDQMPKQVSVGLMFGTALSVPIPDIERTDYLLMLGANPWESNGSLLTAPDLPGKLEALRERGGRFVVVDPRRTRTAEHADEHIAILPGTDAHLLAAIANVLLNDGLTDLAGLESFVNGVDEVAALVAPFTPEASAPRCGIDAATIRRIAHELAAAPTAAVYGRIGTCTQEFGTLASWLVDVVNVLTGNLDRPGGAMFTRAAAGATNTRGAPGIGRGIAIGRRTSRVRELPEVFGEMPVVCLAEEIETPGEGQIRALITVAGNPVLSTPDSARLDAALGTLEFMVSVDIYVNETTRHADVVLPAPSTLTRGHYDVALYQLALRNVANYSPPILPLAPGEVDEWEILLRLALIVAGQGTAADPHALDEAIALGLLQKAVTDEHGNVHGRDPVELLAMLAPRRGPERLLDLMLRTGPYGDGFGTIPDGLTLAELEAKPHGIDLGALEPRLPDVLRTPSGKIELAPPLIAADVERLRASLDRTRNGEMVLVGRRDLRSNNSWMHNVEVLVKGKPRCTLHVNPDDATRAGLVHGGRAKVSSRVGTVVADVEITDAVRPGVVSLPHGWGHDLDGTSQSVARRHAGVNVNVLADPLGIDPLSGNAILNGVPVTLAPA
jgi:anaerobic selenocysteine-containing dehydrogenase